MITSYHFGHRKDSEAVPPIENVLEGHVNIPWIPLTQAVVASLTLDSHLTR